MPRLWLSDGCWRLATARLTSDCCSSSDSNQSGPSMQTLRRHKVTCSAAVLQCGDLQIMWHFAGTCQEVLCCGHGGQHAGSCAQVWGHLDNHEWLIRTFLYTGTFYASWFLHIFQCLHWYLQTNMAHGWSIVLFVLNIAADYYLSSIIGLDPVKKKTQCLRWTHGWDIGWSWQLCLYQVHILVLTVHLYCDAYCLCYRGYPG